MKSKIYVFLVPVVVLGVIAQLIWSPNARMSLAITLGVTLGLILLAAAATSLVKFLLPNSGLKHVLLRSRGGRRE